MKKLLTVVFAIALVAVMAVCAFADTYPVNSSTLTFRVGGSTGVSLSDNVLSMSTGASNAYWANAQMMGANDDLKDGFTVKITDIVWDTAGDNAVGVVYGNTNFMGTNAVENGSGSNFTLLVKRDGSVDFWGNGCNSNHVWGKWAGVHAEKTGILAANPTEFTYKMVPNADNSVYTFYVNDKVVFEYNIATVATQPSSFYDKSILLQPDKPCNFGFQILSATGTWGTGHSSAPTGSLSFKIAEVDSVGVVENNDDNNDDNTDNNITSGNVYDISSLAIRLPGRGLTVSGNTVSFSKADTSGDPPVWSNAQIMDINDDIKDGFTLKLSNIAWDSANNNAIAIIYGNTAHMGTNGIE